MQLMSKQRREAIQRMEDAQSPFRDTKSQTIFKNAANLTLRGSTYDAKHLDMFLTSGYGEKSFNPERSQQKTQNQSQTLGDKTVTESLEDSVIRNRSLHAHLPSYLVNSQAIKPSVSFLNLNRQKQVFNHYVDLKAGPSALQKRPDVPTDFEQSTMSAFEGERQNHQDSQVKEVAQLDQARRTLHDVEAQSPRLRMPSEARKEIENVRAQLNQYKAFKTEHQFLTKRDRLMRTAWKHGVTGIDDADSNKTQVFYSDKRDEQVRKQRDADYINNRRQQVISLGLGSSIQHEHSSPKYKRAESLHHQGRQDIVVDIKDDWKVKHAVAKEINPPRTETTNSRIFESASNVDRKKQEGCMNKIKIERAAKLNHEDSRLRGFNPITGATMDKAVWAQAMGDQKL